MRRALPGRVGRHRVAPGRFGLALLVLAYLVGTFASASHWLTTRHRLCEVHGTLEHAGEDEGGGVVSMARGAPTGPIVRSESRAHAACDFGSLAAPDIAPLDLESRTVTIAPRPLPARTPVDRPRAMEPRHGLAPSRSPPAA